MSKNTLLLNKENPTVTLKPGDCFHLTNNKKLKEKRLILLTNHQKSKIHIKIDFTSDGKYVYVTDKEEGVLVNHSNSGLPTKMVKGYVYLFLVGESYIFHLRHNQKSSEENKYDRLLINFVDHNNLTLHLIPAGEKNDE